MKTSSNTHPSPGTSAAVPPPLWRIRLQAIALFVLVAAFVLGLPILLGWGYGLLTLLVLGAAILAVASAWVLRRFSPTAAGRPFALVWSRSLIGWTLVLGVVVAAPFYYLMVVTDTRPATVPQVSLTNGSKRVVFQGMQHIGSERFYQAVIYDVEKALSEGYVSYYEGVQTPTPESKAFFEKLSHELVGGSDLSGTYKSIGEVCGMKFQLDYFGLLEADKAEHPKRHLVADVDAIELKAEYDRLMREDPVFAKAHANDFQPKPAANDNAFMLKMVEWLKSGSESQKTLGGVTCRGLFSLNQAAASTTPGRMEPVILDFRNRALAQRIMQSPDDKIFITYGAAHLPGLVAELRKLDPKWEVGSVKWLRTIEAPEHIEGQLRGLGN
ncbi:hypothetical protein LNV08_10040 [Paucibacter sp. TC2R-5]|uniref:hypothetical protein n=1 Tax=Paucibacter sp. TC2R-5 TaxID=2893555 RepID=UPI0021E3A968|nr:hypothetical protein [Paucibacter sp. TC2R-5]MCV2359312.1 hypothetical protein [Paucibacter sp. TC2R-5]